MVECVKSILLLQVAERRGGDGMECIPVRRGKTVPADVSNQRGQVTECTSFVMKPFLQSVTDAHKEYMSI